jgi:amino acid permease
MNQCNDDEKERRKEKDYKNVFEILLSTAIIAVIIIIIIIINIIAFIIIEENEYENCVNHLEDFDILFICFVEFFASVSFLKEKD